MSAVIPLSADNASPDIFVSYAWLDHPELSKTRWVLRFAEALEHAVGFELGHNVKVWVDLREIRATNKVGEVLTMELKKSRLMVALMSKAWLKSDWCPEELRAFRHTHSGDKLNEDVVVVELHPLEREWASLIDVPGLPFYRKIGYETYRPYGHPIPANDDNRFYDEIAILATQSAKRLNRIRADPPTDTVEATIRSIGQANAVPSRRSPWLWLTDAVPSLALEQRKLVEMLTQENFDVVELQVAGKRLLSKSDIEAAVRASMSGACMLIQLLDESPGALLANTQENWVSLQGNLAREHAIANSIPFVRWRRPGSRTLSDENWRKSLMGAIEQDIEGFCAELLKQLREMRDSLNKTPTLVPDPPEFCLIYAEEDYLIATKIGELLRELQVNYESVVTLAQVYDLTVADHKDDENSQTIRSASGIIIVYGKATREWLSSTVKHLHHLRGRRGRWGILIDTPGVITTGLIKPMPPLSSTIERHDWRERPQPELLQQFITSIRSAPQR